MSHHAGVALFKGVQLRWPRHTVPQHSRSQSTHMEAVVTLLAASWLSPWMKLEGVACLVSNALALLAPLVLARWRMNPVRAHQCGPLLDTHTHTCHQCAVVDCLMWPGQSGSENRCQARGL